MKQSEWMPLYSEILEDMGYDRLQDESCARLLKAVTMNSDLVTLRRKAPSYPLVRPSRGSMRWA